MNKIVDKECEQCGTMMHQVSSRKKYCTECARLRNNEGQTKRYAARKSDEYTPHICMVDKRCEQCGRMMHGVAKHRQFCQECAANRVKASNDFNYAKGKRKKLAELDQNKKPAVTLKQAVRAAKVAGMTYGQWVLHNRLESEQNGMD